jgi:hypothetical protein
MTLKNLAFGGCVNSSDLVVFIYFKYIGVLYKGKILKKKRVVIKSIRKEFV